ncbi:DNA-binding response regulator [Carnobacterium maltaromaticum]|uniref:response regulator transcription factor n=1 Tax=Carnobacterium maltaromaticum TaxID=2751 RepID=UPI000C757BF8|nr:response regulator transcription factor [Carnobacterium maltaromaticum]PLS34549.1 DNA-binding response regulator [Carnobacterium maltaromaticum]PLS35054.1 DNA-binding response regulator [Carnobacterium maltaromaticum]PLS35467.1 DNA-binding response regulator [Carnobacterium maltaromaticum]PLS42021.1 DNA-binding response regulator [Carnobacterium maltaromaticum]PLS44856.1 DNA-binding response regulator [Carnobacterium maltaromaticum]
MKKVLLIEDERSIAELQQDYLEINGISSVISVDSQEGLELALNDNFDLILLDLMLPTLNGFEICKEVRKVKDIPIIMVSAKKEEIDKIRGLGLGADDYLTKPFSPGELIARVKSRLARYERLTASHQPTETIEIDGINVDKRARKVFVFEEEQFFTTKEFDLLVYLMEHPNQVLSKEQLFQQVWGMEIYGGDVATVVVHIKKIREKMKQTGSSPLYIETIWGSGYRFNQQK